MLVSADPLAGVVAVAAAIVSYSRYVDQQWKMTALTYGTAVIVSKAGAAINASAAEAAPE